MSLTKMAVGKRNAWLEAEDDEEELEGGYDSEAQEESRGALAGRSIKRRKVDEESDEDDVLSDEDGELDRDPTARQRRRTSPKNDDVAPAQEDERLSVAEEEEEEDGNHSTAPDGLDEQNPRTAARPPTVKPLTAKQLARSQRAVAKTGVIYLSRIPPFMKPSTLKSLLTPFGTIGRIFLTPEDATQHQRRVRNGGNKKKSYTDGWVEFESKRDAKMVATVLNGNIVGGKKGGYYHDDVWNMRYLKAFKWHHLTEQISNENAERAARLTAEISRSRRENREFVRDVERGKMIEGIKAKKAARDGGGGGGVGAVAATRTAADLGVGEIATRAPVSDERRRTFKQNVARSKKQREEKSMQQPEATERVLGKLF